MRRRQRATWSESGWSCARTRRAPPATPRRTPSWWTNWNGGADGPGRSPPTPGPERRADDHLPHDPAPRPARTDRLALREPLRRGQRRRAHRRGPPPGRAAGGLGGPASGRRDLDVDRPPRHRDRRTRLPGARPRTRARTRSARVRLRGGGRAHPRRIRRRGPEMGRGVCHRPGDPSLPRGRGPAHGGGPGDGRAAPDRTLPSGAAGTGRRAQHAAAAGAVRTAVDPARRLPPGPSAIAQRGGERGAAGGRGRRAALLNVPCAPDVSS